MTYQILFKKTSTCKSNPDIEYLDENSDYKLKYKAQRMGVSLDDLKQKNEEIQQSISYLTKEEHGQVYACGYLRDMLLKRNGTAPEKWDNDSRKKAITSSIHKIVVVIPSG